MDDTHLAISGTWTIQRCGRMKDGKYRWRLFDDGEAVAISGHVSFENAYNFAKVYIDGLHNRPTSTDNNSHPA